MSKERQDQVILFRVNILSGSLSHRAEIETGSSQPDRQPQDSGCKVQKSSLQAGLVGSGQSGQDWISQTQIQLLPVQLLQLFQVH